MVPSRYGTAQASSFSLTHETKLLSTDVGRTHSGLRNLPVVAHENCTAPKISLTPTAAERDRAAPTTQYCLLALSNIVYPLPELVARRHSYGLMPAGFDIRSRVVPCLWRSRAYFLAMCSRSYVDPAGRLGARLALGVPGTPRHHAAGVSSSPGPTIARHLLQA